MDVKKSENQFCIDVLDKPGDAFFDPSRMLIYLHREKSLAKDEILKHQVYAELVHEYTHYLQLTTTVYGINYLLLLTDTCMRVIDHFNRNQTSKLSAELFEKIRRIRTHQYYAEKHAAQTEEDATEGTERVLQKIEVPVERIYDSVSDSYFSITPQMLREHMAMMAYGIARGMGIDALLVHFNETKVSPVYRLLFEKLVMNLPDQWDLRVVMYYLCELALMSNIPTVVGPRIISEFIEFAKKHASALTSADDAMNQFLKTTWEKERVRENLDGLEKLLAPLTLWFELHSDNDGMRALAILHHRIRAGIQFRRQFPSVYKRGLGSTWLEWAVSEFGSPVVMYKGGECTLLGQTSDDPNDLAFVLGFLHILHDFDDLSTITECPFWRDLPICGVDPKPLSICEVNATAIEADEEGKACTLFHILSFLGQKKKVGDRRSE
ncbi:MAG: hypothetical protein JNM27_13670 [Leptospirales bacterium]|nr:hypothetical protein [Leptospirales bacterium]